MQLVDTKRESSVLLTLTHLNFKQSHWVRIMANQVLQLMISDSEMQDKLYMAT